MNIMDAALQYISESACSESELRKRLKKKFAYLADIDKHLQDTIEHLKTLKLLSDHRIAVRYAFRYSHKGDEFIVQALQKEGVSQQEIHEILSTLESESSRATDAAKKKARSFQTRFFSPNLEYKLFQFLKGRGFSQASIRTAITNLEDIDSSALTLDK